MRLQFAVVNVKLDAILAGVAQALKLLLQNQASLDSILLDLTARRDEALEIRANMSRLIQDLASHFDAQNQRYCIQYWRRRDPAIPLQAHDFARCLSDYVSRGVASNLALTHVPDLISEDKIADNYPSRMSPRNIRQSPRRASRLSLQNSAIPQVFESRLPELEVWAASVGGYFGFSIQWVDRYRQAIPAEDLAEFRSVGQDIERFVANHVGGTRPERERILGEIWKAYKSRLEESRLWVAATLIDIAKQRARIVEGPLKVDTGLPACPGATFTPNRARAGLGAPVALQLPSDLGEKA